MLFHLNKDCIQFHLTNFISHVSEYDNLFIIKYFSRFKFNDLHNYALLVFKGFKVGAK